MNKLNEIVISHHENYILIFAPFTLTISLLKQFYVKNKDLLSNNHLIWDIRETNLSPLDTEFIKGIVELIGSIPMLKNPYRNALVTTVEKHSRSIRRLIKTISKNRLSARIECFNYLHSAIKWIRER